MQGEGAGRIVAHGAFAHFLAVVDSESEKDFAYGVETPYNHGREITPRLAVAAGMRPPVFRPARRTSEGSP